MINIPSLISWMNDNGLIEEQKRRFFATKGMSIELLERSLNLVYPLIKEDDISFAYAGALRSRNSDYSALMIFSRQKFLFLHYNGTREVYVDIYGKNNIIYVGAIDSLDNIHMSDLGIATMTPRDPDHIYAIHISSQQYNIINSLQLAINQMDDPSPNLQVGIFQL